MTGATTGAARIGPRVEIVVIAKEPVPGRVKTRLTPPYSPTQAAALAEAALTDTLRAVSKTPNVGRTLALAGTPGDWLPADFTVIPQRGAGLDERLAAAFADTHARSGGPVVIIGMDTPQVTPDLLADAVTRLAPGLPATGLPTTGLSATEVSAPGSPAARRVDAVFGPADDGGYWLLGLRVPDPALVRGVPMSCPDTGAAQLARLRAAGLSVHQMPRLRDVDTREDAMRVAGHSPHTGFAALVRTMRPMRRRRTPSDPVTGAATPSLAAPTPTPGPANAAGAVDRADAVDPAITLG